MGSSSASNNGKTRRRRKPKSICLPFLGQAHYQSCMEDRDQCRSYLLQMRNRHPELFPQAMAQGFKFNGFLYSKKQPLAMRRIKCKKDGEQYQIRPSFMMPYMIAPVEDVEKPLFFRRWGVPFEALVYGFGKDPMFWYRAYCSLGRPSVVGATIKDPKRLPLHLIGDEKHTRLRGKRVFVATTVAQGCILGAEVVETAGTTDLKKGYGVFRKEALNLQPDYHPETVTTDKWDATCLPVGTAQNAWKILFPFVTLILCFLHGFLKIKDRCKRDKGIFACIQEKVWNLYHAPSLASFAQRCRRLREWTLPRQMVASAKEKILELCAKAADYKVAYLHPGAYRTSNGLERLMNYQDRILYSAQYFHGTRQSASLFARAMAMVWNFHPYDLRTQDKYGLGASPFEQLNGFRYHDNWLQNLLIAASTCLPPGRSEAGKHRLKFR